MNYTSSFTIESTTNPGVSFTIHKPSQGRRVDFDRRNARFRDRMRELRKESDAVRAAVDAMREDYSAGLENKLAAARKAEPVDAALVARLENSLEIERLRSVLINIPGDTPAEQTRPLVEKIAELAKNAEHFVVPVEFREEQGRLNTETTIEIEGLYKLERIRWGLKSMTGLAIDGVEVADANTLIEVGPADLVAEVYEAVEKASQMTPEQLKNSQWPTTSNAVAGGPTTATTAESVSTEATGAAATAANTPS